MAKAQDALDVTNAKLFDYQREVVVELHGETADGEFDVVSYRFRQDPDEDGLLQFQGSFEGAHEDAVRDELDRQGYALR